MIVIFFKLPEIKISIQPWAGVLTDQANTREEEKGLGFFDHKKR